MAYGITKESQLIDLSTIKSACDKYKDALNDFEKCGVDVNSAGIMCNEKALSVDDNAIEITLTEMAEEIKNVKSQFSACADQVYADAVDIYNNQMTELNEYNRRKAEEEK